MKNCTEVAKPKIVHFDSENCPEHWNNVIIFGRCWRHDKGVAKETPREQLLQEK